MYQTFAGHKPPRIQEIESKIWATIFRIAQGGDTVWELNTFFEWWLASTSVNPLTNAENTWFVNLFSKLSSELNIDLCKPIFLQQIH